MVGSAPRSRAASPWFLGRVDSCAITSSATKGTLWMACDPMIAHIPGSIPTTRAAIRNAMAEITPGMTAGSSVRPRMIARPQKRRPVRPTAIHVPMNSAMVVEATAITMD